MKTHLNRRSFLRDTSLAAAATLAVGVRAADTATPLAAQPPKSAASFPTGWIGGHEFTRLILGGNLISGYAHARDLGYVAQLMRHYNTEAKILETLELAEAQGINAINLFIGDDLSFLQKHWKNGGKMKLIAQAHILGEGDLSQWEKAIDTGASAVHLQGHSAERLVAEDRVDLIAKAMDFARSRHVATGVAAHAHRVVVECEQAGVNVDFYLKTLHTRDYSTALPPGQNDEVGPYDNSWCANADEVMKFMASVKKPWIAFKVMAAGAIPARTAFPFAFKSGADFLLAGMFDWQIAEDAQLARKAIANAQRERPWFGTKA